MAIPIIILQIGEGHDSAFKDRYLQLQNVRLSFIPTEKADIHDLEPIEEVNMCLSRGELGKGRLPQLQRQTSGLLRRIKGSRKTRTSPNGPQVPSLFSLRTS